MASANGHPASLMCTGCGLNFRCSARRVRMVLRGQASRLCPMCLQLSRKGEVLVLPEHKIWWRALVENAHVTVSGEVVTQEWIDELADLIWG